MLFKIFGFLCFLCLIGALVGAFFLDGWLKSPDKPDYADAIVVLGGSYARPLYAADLVARGYSGQVFVPRAEPGKNTRFLLENGYPASLEQDVYTALLRKRGVSPEKIVLFGESLVSTYEEAEALAAEFDMRRGGSPGKLLVVTSPYHVRRARMIFRDRFPDWTLYVVATPYEPVPDRWWSRQESAQEAILEIAKIGFHLFGGRFRQGEKGESIVTQAPQGALPELP